MNRRPHISVVIPTFRAPHDVEGCLDSLTKTSYPNWDILLVDQSDDARTQQVAECFASRLPQLRFRHLDVQGTCHARNVGIQETEGEIIAFLDHDCTPKPNWLVEAAAVFERHPQAGNVYGAVTPPNGLPEWGATGWTPSLSRDTESEVKIAGDMKGVRNHFRVPRLIGMGACMFVRRDIIPYVGTFDTHFGPGTPFASNEDGDYGYRTLMAGYSIVNTPAVVVEHHGFRDYESGAASRHLHSYQYSTGTWLMKILRLGDPVGPALIAIEAWRYLSYISPSRLIPGRGPSGLSGIVLFVRGLIDSFQLRVDRRTKLYVDRSRKR